jgi:HPt (histidine-containing phosphotransfer) domain-containing protein
MDDYLSKPINTNELNHIFKKYLNIEKPSNKTLEINLETIKNKLGISETIVNLIVNKFKENIQNDLKELENYILEENLKQIKEKAHYIKNSCLNICLDKAVDILQSMETEIEEINSLKKSYKNLENLLKDLN